MGKSLKESLEGRNLQHNSCKKILMEFSREIFEGISGGISEDILRGIPRETFWETLGGTTGEFI